MRVIASGWKMRVFTNSSHDMPDALRDHFAGGDEHDVLVLVRRCGTACDELDVSDAPDHVLARERRVVPQLVVAAEAGAMRDDVADRDLRVGAEIGRDGSSRHACGPDRRRRASSPRPASPAPSIVNAFDVDAIWNSVSAVTGSVPPNSFVPYPLTNTTRSFFTIATATPGICHAFIVEVTIRSIGLRVERLRGGGEREQERKQDEQSRRMAGIVLGLARQRAGVGRWA